MRAIYTMAIAILALMLSACATPVYRVGDKSFADRKDAEAARKASADTTLAKISPRTTPVAKTGRVIILSKALVAGRVLREGGNPEGRDYVATAVFAGMQDIAEAIRKRNIFERLDVEETSDGGQVTPKPGEVAIYFYKPDRNAGGWNYVSESTKRTPLHFDETNPDHAGRFMYFLDRIEALAAAEPR